MSRLTECGTKTQYKTRREAIAGVDHLRRTSLTIAKMSVYRCSYCGFWHYGHYRRGKPARRR